MRNYLQRSILAVIGLTLSASIATAQKEEAIPPAPEVVQFGMTGERLQEIALQIDENAVIQGNLIQFTMAETQVAVVFDPNAQRMRTMVPVASVDVLNERLMQRMLQANYDSVLDARYAISNGLVWAVFIHPLDTLTETDFTSGLLQCIIAAQTFGKEFTSGAMVFGGGDSNDLRNELLESLNQEPDRGI